MNSSSEETHVQDIIVLWLLLTKIISLDPTFRFNEPAISLYVVLKHQLLVLGIAFVCVMNTKIRGTTALVAELQCFSQIFEVCIARNYSKFQCE